MRRFSKIVAHFEEISLGVMVSFTLVLIFLNVILRYSLHYTLTGAEELSRFLFIAITYFGAAAGVRRKGHIIVDLVNVFIPKSVTYLEKLSSLFAALFSILLFYSSYRYAIHLFDIEQISVGLGVPMWIPYLGVIVGSLLLSYRFAEAFYLNCKRTNQL